MDATKMMEEAAAENAAASLDEIREMVSKMQEAESCVEELEVNLKEAKAKLNDYKTRQIPEAMAAAGMRKVVLDDGYEVSIHTFTSGTINNAPKGPQDAIEYLSSIGGEQLIKDIVSVQFGRGEHNLATDFYQSALENEFIPDPERKMTVHPQSLGSFVRERLESGEAVDVDRLGMMIGTVAKSKKG